MGMLILKFARFFRCMNEHQNAHLLQGNFRRGIRRSLRKRCRPLRPSKPPMPSDFSRLRYPREEFFSLDGTQ